jgi:hypothetical protein
MPTNSRAAKYKRTIRATARQLGVPPSSELARHVSLLKMAREQMEIRLIEGRGDLDPNHLLRIDDALRQYLPAAEPAGVQLTIQTARLCHRCKAELEAESPLSPPATEPPPSGGARLLPPSATALEGKPAADPAPPITSKPFAAPDNELVPLTNVRFRG